MARALRVEYEGAVYHATSRGHERSPIFRDDKDREKFLEILGSVVAQARWVVHAYCLMGNHYHLLVETPLGNLSRGMQRLNGRYTQWFNLRHHRVGHVLQGRYRAIVVEKEAHLLELARYVVLNPVRARMADGPGQWRWSNYGATSGRARAPEWLEVDWTLEQFSRRAGPARDLYRRFVAEGKGAGSPLSGKRHQIYLGGEDFLKEIDARLKGARIGSDIPRRQRAPAPIGIEVIRKAVAREFRVKPEALSRVRGGEDKMAAIYLAWKLSGRGGREIAEAFGIKPARVSNVVTEIDRGERPELYRRLERIRRALEKPHNV